MLYFAYGSNMDPLQMAQRCPRAEAVGIAVLQDHELCFPRLSAKRECGVSSVSARAGKTVWGVVYRLTTSDLESLDIHEGFQPGREPMQNNYNRAEAIVLLNGVLTPVSIYLATSQDDPPPPSATYLRHLREGARHHGLPADYLEMLDSLATA